MMDVWNKGRCRSYEANCQSLWGNNASERLHKLAFAHVLVEWTHTRNQLNVYSSKSNELDISQIIINWKQSIRRHNVYWPKQSRAAKVNAEERENWKATDGAWSYKVVVKQLKRQSMSSLPWPTVLQKIVLKLMPQKPICNFPIVHDKEEQISTLTLEELKKTTDRIFIEKNENYYQNSFIIYKRII